MPKIFCSVNIFFLIFFWEMERRIKGHGREKALNHTKKRGPYTVLIGGGEKGRGRGRSRGRAIKTFFCLEREEAGFRFVLAHFLADFRAGQGATYWHS